MQGEITIGYITVEDPNDRRTWSGINFFLMRAVERAGAKVVVLGPLRPQPLLFFCQAFNFLSTRLLGKRYNYRDSNVLSRAYARRLLRRMKDERLDVLLAPAGLSTTANLKTTVPIIYFNDRCLAGALDYHRILKDLFSFSRKEGLALERAALKNAALSIYASHWAADAARLTAPTEAYKVHVIPMGANLDEPPVAPTPRAFPPAVLNLLFLGVKWEDKGGPIAYAALQELKRRGVAARLIVCGCTPPADLTDTDLVREGFLNKNVPADARKLEQYLRTADFLIVPTRFEAYGIVFCEAAAYGLPVLATRTGGVPTIVEDGRTGFLFSMNEGGAAYADRIEQMVKDPTSWQVMRTNARQRFENALTWDAFVAQLFSVMGSAALTSKLR
ncbi:MAG: glycosyltransferase family 4 protein [Flavobacteriales bacterium]